MQFSAWYIKHDPELSKFITYLLLFIISIITLISAHNTLQLFIGWEAVGFMSFLLISWWNDRINAKTAALQAIIYNRIGDIGLVLIIAWLAINFNTWDYHPFYYMDIPTLPLFGLILAAAGKSAQFGLHPWLPAAIEGPTPVSALLHSSTIVVAGVFLLIRFHPILKTSPAALTLCLCVGALTTIFTALCATTQNDLKKIIAFSTSSQLGLIFITIGFNQPDLAFLHITTHAFFKALLFICSGSIIHNIQGEQDIRKIGGLLRILPLTANCIILATAALTGIPFLAGFYTKDAIIESLAISKTNAWALLIALLATALTTAYSLRLIFFVQLNTSRNTTIIHITEVSPNQTKPIQYLAWGSITTGFITSIITPVTNPQITIPLIIKLLALMVTLLGFLLALDVIYQTTQLNKPMPTPTHTTITQLSYFNTLVHRYVPISSLHLAQTISLQLKDLAWYEYIIPLYVKSTTTLITTKLSLLQTGTIKTHLMPLLLLLICLVPLKL